MEAHGDPAHHGHEMPTEGRALTAVSISATLHCLTGCAIGEVAGMAIGTAAGLSNVVTVILSIVLAFVFGYGLTSMPLLRSGAHRRGGVGGGGGGGGAPPPRPARPAPPSTTRVRGVVNTAIIIAIPG